MQNLKDTVNEFNSLIQNQQWEEALDKFYDENLVSADNEGAPITGLPAMKKALAGFVSNSSDMKLVLKNVIVSDDMSVTQWRYSFNHALWGKFDQEQLSLQRWKDGKIIHERHHYKTDKF
jgi:hypothetical protein